MARRARSTGCGSPTPASRAWPTGCAPSPVCPIRSARCSTAGRRPNGLQITRTRVPLGVIAIIYENRPNVTSDAAGLCVKAGNAALLRGSSTALRSNIAVASVLRDALAKHGLPEDAVILVEDTAYETATAVMQLTDYVDCLIPRGGPSLIQSIRDNATVPVIIDGDGNCHVYVDASADLDEARQDRRQRQDAAHERVQRGGVAGRARGGRRRVRAADRRPPARARRRAGRRRREPQAFRAHRAARPTTTSGASSST